MPTPDPSATLVWVQGVDPAFFDYSRLAIFAIVMAAGCMVFTFSLAAAILAFRR